MKSLLYSSIGLTLLLLFLPGSVMAQDIDEELHEDNIDYINDSTQHVIYIDGQVRSRGEYRHGSIKPLTRTGLVAYFVNERARLSIGYASKNVQLKISGQHTGVWGDQSLTGSSNGFSLAEAWGQISTNNNKFTARLGRQALSYDNGRILGANDWTTTGTFHNALRLCYEDKWNKVHVIGALSQNKERSYSTYYVDSITNLYKNLEVIWYHFGNESFPVQASVLLMNAGYEAGSLYTEKTFNRQTMGANISYNTDHFGADIEGYYQRGDESDKISTSAWMAAVNLRYTINKHWTVKGGFDYISGSDSVSTKNKSFTFPFGSLHGFYGAMDYFGSNYFTLCHSGLSDAHASVQWNANKNLYIFGAYHFLSTSADQIRLSNEIDINASWQLNKDINIMGGGSFAFNSKNMNYLIGGSNKRSQYCAFIQVNVSPRILFHRW